MGKETVPRLSRRRFFFLIMCNEIQTCDTWGRRGKTAEAHRNIWYVLDLEEEKNEGRAGPGRGAAKRRKRDHVSITQLASWNELYECSYINV